MVLLMTIVAASCSVYFMSFCGYQMYRFSIVPKVKIGVRPDMAMQKENDRTVQKWQSQFLQWLPAAALSLLGLQMIVDSLPVSRASCYALTLVGAVMCFGSVRVIGHLRQSGTPALYSDSFRRNAAIAGIAMLLFAFGFSKL